MKSFFSNLAALVLLIFYSSISIYAVKADNCSAMTDAVFQSLVLALPCALGSMILYFSYGSNIKYRWAVNVLAAIILFPVLKTWAPLLLSSTIQGHHLCGREFDALVQKSGMADRFLPLIHLVSSTVMMIMLLSISLNRMKRGVVMGPFYIE